MKKILLAEGNSFLLGIYASQIRKNGYGVDFASDGELVLIKIKENNPDLLLLDVALPKINGWEVLRMIKEDIKSKNLKVAVLADFGEKEDIQKSIEMGAIKYFIKAEHTSEDIAREIKIMLG